MPIIDHTIIRAIRIAELMAMRRDGIALTQSENEEFEQLKNDSPPFHDEGVLSDQEIIEGIREINRFADRNRMELIIAPAEAMQIKVRRIRYFPVWARIAAMLVPVIGMLGVYLFSAKNEKPPDKTLSAKVDINTLVPASAHAELTLGDGTQIILEKSSPVVLPVQGDAAVRLERPGELTYRKVGAHSRAAVTNTLKTPRGGHYKLVLSDGTAVWLNAASSLSYPAVFSDTIRRVRLSGEAYFEVSPRKNSRFVVDVGNEVNVEVLGTHFNVHAYSKNLVTATLLEGTVLVRAIGYSASSTGDLATVQLQPGQAAEFRQDASNDAGKQNSVLQWLKKADTSSVVAWKNGYFSFNNRPFELAIQDISRWYNVEIILEKPTHQMALWGEIDRQLPFVKLLDFLSKAGVRYRVDDSGRVVLAK